jgi:prevent-host-death family protein
MYNAASVKENLRELLFEVNESHMPILIEGEGHRAVMLSADDWRSIEETLYLNSVPGLADSILEAAREADEDCLPAEEAI